MLRSALPIIPFNAGLFFLRLVCDLEYCLPVCFMLYAFRSSLFFVVLSSCWTNDLCLSSATTCYRRGAVCLKS